MHLLRLVPATNLLQLLPRYVRDLAQTLKKEVELTITDENVKIDKLVLEGLKNPIIHILRNAIDHGIESNEQRKEKNKPIKGNINIAVKEQGDHVEITICDDGAGINTKKIKTIIEEKKIMTSEELEKLTEDDFLQFIFNPGFSTRDTITDTSGRGVGLDVVKSNMTQLKGHVTIKTDIDKGTTFLLHVPLTLASERGLLVKSSGQLFVIPTSCVYRVLSTTMTDLSYIEGNQTIIVDQHTIAVRYLSDILEMNTKERLVEDQLSIAVIQNGTQFLALLVDEILGEREIVIKPLHTPLKKILFVSGGTLLESNQVIIVLNPNELIDSAFTLSHTSLVNSSNQTIDKKMKTHILVVDDSITTRTLEKNILESKNYQVTVAVNGKEAWDILQKQPFSLLITDVSMPIMDGFTLTDHVKKSEKLRGLPVIIVTSLGSDAEKKRGIEVGADAYLIKNEFESGALLKIVSQLV